MKFVTRLFGCRRVGSAAVAASLAFLGASSLRADAAPPVGLIASGVASQADGFGTIKGRLVWGGAEAPKRKILEEKGKAKKDPAVCAVAAEIPDDGLVVDPKTKGIQYGFAYLMKPKGTNPKALQELVAKHPKVELDQKNCRFVPHVVAFTQDQPVVFKSSDPTSHNLRFSPFQNAPLNQILPANGMIEMKLIPEKRPIELKCDIHPWMTGYMMVFDHPFFAITGEDGSFEIQGVPAGTQSLIVWQEKVGFVTKGAGTGSPVVVKAGETSDFGDVKLDPAKVR